MPTQTELVQKCWRELARSQFEVLIALTPDGMREIKRRTDNDAHHVLNFSDIDNVQGAIMLHSHPAGASIPSYEDVLAAIYNDVRELHVVTKTEVCIFERPSEGWSEEMEVEIRKMIWLKQTFHFESPADEVLKPSLTRILGQAPTILKMSDVTSLLWNKFVARPKGEKSQDESH